VARFATVVVALLLLSVAARAESPLEQEARQHYNKGQKLFDASDYASAASEFRKAFELTHYPAILYRVALCEDQSGRFDEALRLYVEYLERDPQSDRRTTVEARIATLRQLAEQNRAESPPTVVAASTPAPAPAAPPPKPRPLYKRWWLWTAVVLAAGAIAVGVGVGVTQSRSLTLSNFNPNLPAQGGAVLVRF
jgi:tetratricopeptide (TPR) repeat protein